MDARGKGPGRLAMELGPEVSAHDSSWTNVVPLARGTTPLGPWNSLNVANELLVSSSSGRRADEAAGLKGLVAIFLANSVPCSCAN